MEIQAGMVLNGFQASQKQHVCTVHSQLTTALQMHIPLVPFWKIPPAIPHLGEIVDSTSDFLGYPLLSILTLPNCAQHPEQCLEYRCLVGWLATSSLQLPVGTQSLRPTLY